MSEELERVYTSFLNNQVHSSIHVLCMGVELVAFAFRIQFKTVCSAGARFVVQCSISITQTPQLLGQGSHLPNTLCRGNPSVIHHK